MMENDLYHTQNYDIEVYEFPQLMHQNNLMILHMNIRSLNANLDEFTHVMNNTYQKADLIIFTECWITNVELFSEAIQNFEFVSSDKHNRSGGVAIFANNATVKIVNIEQGALDACDSLLIRLEFANEEYADLIGIYRSPSMCPALFNESLENYLQKRDTEVQLLGLVGDFNLCYNLSDTDINSEKLYDNTLKYGLLPMIHTPTRVTINTHPLVSTRCFCIHSYYKNITL